MSDPTLHELAQRVDELLAQVADMTTAWEQLGRALTAPASSGAWLELDDVDQARDLLDDLTAWTGRVLTTYADELPVCWAEHPAAVEELLALRRAHGEAYSLRRGSGAAQVQWHQTYRPGVMARVSALLGGAKGCPDHPRRLFNAS